ncbi:MAG: methylase involved in ubiquinone/menaquinone biosynthesis [Schlesneria sp.]|nr:methylase involved in ubiquinone/menaquinone biosynthesis [Schlesneria sp.]
MLKSLVPKLICPTCGQSDATLSAHVFDDGDAGHIRNGIVQCPRCSTIYPIEDDLLELVSPSLLNPEECRRFSERFRGPMNELGVSFALSSNEADPAVGAQLKQREHFDWYADNQEQTYHDYALTPFWTAADRQTFQRWKAQVAPGSWLLDVGCANGRASYSWVGFQQMTVVGFDISKKLVRQAIERSRAEGSQASTSFLVGDGNMLPFADNCFDYAMTYGVLHHLPDPGLSTARIIDILKPGGIFFGSENNQSIFRGLFDLMMKLKPLWTEEAGAEPLISRQMLRAWTAERDAKLSARSIVFLPPHLFNLLGHKLSNLLMGLSDRVAGVVPFFRHQGGLIVFEIQKDQAPGSSTTPAANLEQPRTESSRSLSPVLDAKRKLASERNP